MNVFLRNHTLSLYFQTSTPYCSIRLLSDHGNFFFPHNFLHYASTMVGLLVTASLQYSLSSSIPISIPCLCVINLVSSFRYSVLKVFFYLIFFSSVIRHMNIIIAIVPSTLISITNQHHWSCLIWQDCESVVMLLTYGILRTSLVPLTCVPCTTNF